MTEVARMHGSRPQCPEALHKAESASLYAAAAAPAEASTSGKQGRKTGFAPGEWDIAKMAPKLKGQA